MNFVILVRSYESHPEGISSASYKDPSFVTRHFYPILSFGRSEVPSRSAASHPPLLLSTLRWKKEEEKTTRCRPLVTLLLTVRRWAKSLRSILNESPAIRASFPLPRPHPRVLDVEFPFPRLRRTLGSLCRRSWNTRRMQPARFLRPGTAFLCQGSPNQNYSRTRYHPSSQLLSSQGLLRLQQRQPSLRRVVLTI